MTIDEIQFSGGSKSKPMMVVRVTESYFSTQRGLSYRRDVSFLKRKSSGFNCMEEDISCGGADLAYKSIENIDTVKPGVYELKFIEYSRDFETGHCDDWGYKLIPYD
jgi:hypothetical protein